VLGSAYDDWLVGDNTGNVLEGGAGDDILDGAGGADEMRGGDGFDQVTYRDNTPNGQGVTVDLSDNSRNAGAAAGDVLTGIESVQGTEAADTLVGIVRADGQGVELLGEGGNDRLVGRAGNDSLAGGRGNDTLDGGAGGDRMKGGSGNDTYWIDSASDQVVEAADGGIDTAIVALDFRMDALANVEILKLADGTAATRATGGAGSDHLIGNTGFNILDGGAGADTLEGSAGSDVFLVDDAGDVVVEAAGGGTDSVQASVSYRLAADVEVEFLTALGTASIALTGNAFANTLTGNAGSNALDAGAGSDKLIGMAGNDQLSGGAGNDILDGGLDLDFLSAGVGDDRLLGGGGNDTLWGDLGNDQLAGGDGRDILSGGRGRDQFLFDTAVASRRNANIDKITDFSAREGDKIVLENAIFTALGRRVGALNKDMFALDAAHDRSDHIVYNSHNGKLFYDADGAGGHAAIQIAQLKAHLHLDYHAFAVV
jgi:Ca2+-binding RTX toxin-like protein